MIDDRWRNDRMWERHAEEEQTVNHFFYISIKIYNKISQEHAVRYGSLVLVRIQLLRNIGGT